MAIHPSQSFIHKPNLHLQKVLGDESLLRAYRAVSSAAATGADESARLAVATDALSDATSMPERYGPMVHSLFVFEQAQYET